MKLVVANIVYWAILVAMGLAFLTLVGTIFWAIVKLMPQETWIVLGIGTLLTFVFVTMGMLFGWAETTISKSARYKK